MYHFGSTNEYRFYCLRVFIVTVANVITFPAFQQSGVVGLQWHYALICHWQAIASNSIGFQLFRCILSINNWLGLPRVWCRMHTCDSLSTLREFLYFFYFAATLVYRCAEEPAHRGAVRTFVWMSFDCCGLSHASTVHFRLHTCLRVCRSQRKM